MLSSPPLPLPRDHAAELEEEVSSLEAIYGPESFSYDSGGHGGDEVTLAVSSADAAFAITLCLTQYKKHPTANPTFILEGLPRSKRASVTDSLHALLALRNPGEPILFSLLECFREEVGNTAVEAVDDEPGSDLPSPAQQPTMGSPSKVSVFRSAEPLVVMKSTFVGHCATVSSAGDIGDVLNYILSDPRIARATHNIRAWRFRLPSGALVADNDDDGESAAGSRLAMLLESMGAENVIVVVTRWFGGVLMGPSRFKVINECARAVLEDSGLVPPPARKR